MSTSALSGGTWHPRKWRDYSGKASWQSTVDSRKKEETARLREGTRLDALPGGASLAPTTEAPNWRNCASICGHRCSLVGEAAEEGVGLPLRSRFRVGDCRQELAKDVFVGCRGGFVHRLREVVSGRVVAHGQPLLEDG